MVHYLKATSDPIEPQVGSLGMRHVGPQRTLPLLFWQQRGTNAAGLDAQHGASFGHESIQLRRKQAFASGIWAPKPCQS